MCDDIIMEALVWKDSFAMLWRVFFINDDFLMLWRALAWKKISQCYRGLLYERKFLNVMEGPCMNEDFSMLWRALVWKKISQCYGGFMQKRRVSQCYHVGLTLYEVRFSHHGRLPLVWKVGFLIMEDGLLYQRRISFHCLELRSNNNTVQV